MKPVCTFVASVANEQYRNLVVFGALGIIVQVANVGAAVIYALAAAFTIEDNHCMQRRSTSLLGSNLGPGMTCMQVETTNAAKYGSIAMPRVLCLNNSSRPPLKDQLQHQPILTISSFPIKSASESAISVMNGMCILL